MGETPPSQPDLFDGLSPLSKPNEEKWPSLPSSLPSSSPVSSLPASSIPPAQKMPETPISWSVQKKSPEDYSKQRAKYAKFFVGNRILPIPELVEMVQPKIISFIITDLKTRRLAGIKKETFEELLKTAGIPARYFCRRSFATWDVLLPTEDFAKKLAGSNISSKYYRLQPEYQGHRKIRDKHPTNKRKAPSGS